MKVIFGLLNSQTLLRYSFSTFPRAQRLLQPTTPQSSPLPPNKLSALRQRSICAVAPQQNPPSEKDYFTLLNISNPRFLLDNKTLLSSYKSLQQQWHPDRHSTSDSAQQQHASDMSSLINHAYQTLRTPHLRAKYMLKRFGVDFDEENERGGMGDVVNRNEGFLMRMVEMRERIGEADEEALRGIKRENQVEREECYTELDKAFAARELDQARMLVSKLQFLERVARQVDERLPHDQ